jgi:uncharacterized membrane protein
MLLAVFLMFGFYDMLAKTSFARNLKVFGAVAFVVTVILWYLMTGWAGFSYRAYNIHLGAMFGTIMAANVWMRIWPSQRRIIAAVKEGTPPDAAVVALAGQRSRHNTYLSVPLLYTMINMHTVVPGSESPVYFFGALLVGWGMVAYMYGKAGKVKGL